MADWAELLLDLLSTIARKLNLYEDLTAFDGVCRSWRSVAVKKYFSPVQVPWLLLAPPKNNDVINSRDFYSLTKRGMVHTVHLPEARGKKLLSSLGWLITIDEDAEMELLHPLSHARIPLPTAREYRNFDMLSGAALSASPSDIDDYSLMIVIGHLGLLAYWKPGNTSWVTIETNTSPYSFKDVVYHSRGQFYAVNYREELFSVDLDPTTITANLVRTIPGEAADTYLADSGGYLLVVVKKLLHDDDLCSNPLDYEFAPYNHHGIDDDIFINKPIYNYMTASFEVYRFDSSNNDWHLMHDLGGSSLFLGQWCAPVTVPCGVVASIRPDCIYFTDHTNLQYIRKDDIGRNGIEMGVYSLKEERQDTLYQGVPKGRCFLCPPLWVIPSF